MKRVLVFFLSLSAPLLAEYNKPPANILKVLHAPAPPRPSISPTRENLMLVTMQEYPSIARVSTPFLKLAGVRVEPKNRSRHDTPGGYGIAPCATAYTIVGVSDKKQRPVSLPPNACASTPLWSADGQRFAFSNTTDTAVELWVGDIKSGAVHLINNIRLNTMLGEALQWMPDQKHLLVKLVPENQGAAPSASLATLAPSIQESIGEKGQSSTYEARDTLKNKNDEDLFEYYATSQLAIVDVQSGMTTQIGKPALYDSVRPSPSGEFILVSDIRRPYSYTNAYTRFPHTVAIWDSTGHTIHTVAQLPLANRVPIHGAPKGPRDFDWRATEPATLIWAEALDEGDWKVQVPARDKVMMLASPFKKPVEIYKTTQRFGGFVWSDKRELALLSEDDENTHWHRTFIVNPSNPNETPRLLWDFSLDEQYAHPGDPVVRILPNGMAVMVTDNNAIYLNGYGASPEGARPFLDKLDLSTQKSERLFRSAKSAFEYFIAFADQGQKSFVTWHQSIKDPPNAFLRTLEAAIPDALPGEPQFTSTARPITAIEDPTPEIRDIKKRLVSYKRKDGLDLSFTIYTPPHYKEGTRIPAILYAYPLDYAQSSTAGQVTGSQMTFTRLRQYQLLLLAGYAIIDKASFPIVGDPKTAYDTYLEQLVAAAQAAVDKAVEIGIVDRNRIGVTGHSHGALMTVNLIAHSNLFKAGVATSGAYNKVLTPFGFQSERRSLWEAPEVYKNASPYFFADKIKTPLLLIHGEDDANPGTTPLQTRILYEAIRGHGGVVRQVMLPFEPHWYTAMESNEQLIYEMVRWFDRYVKAD